MHKYDYIKNYDNLLDKETLALVSAIHECKGKLDAIPSIKTKSFVTLSENAKIQSTDASNRIEGIVTTQQRLKQIVQNKAVPKNRSEQEILGYANVLDVIHKSYQYIPINPSTILQFHRDMLKVADVSYAGKFKMVDNVIAEYDSHGKKKVRFVPVSAALTPTHVNDLCQAYNLATQDPQIEQLLTIPMFILDFLCIHPFKDGNGRMSRLLTSLLLNKSGYTISQYISIDKLISQTSQTYYKTLSKSSQKWSENKNSYTAFVKYILQLILKAYNQLFQLSTSPQSKTQRVEYFIQQTPGKVTKSKIQQNLPDISKSTVQYALYNLVKQNKINKVTSGKYASYVWNWESDK